jgi:hypothetical protein
MTAQLAGTIAVSPPPHGRRRWRAALSGLTPRMLAIVAAILFARALGTPLAWNELRDIPANTLSGFFQLIVTVAPMLVAIVVTGNLGPRRGARRLAALVAAVVLSSGAALVLRVAIADFIGSGPRWSDLRGFLSLTWPRYAALGGLLTFALEVYRRELVSTQAAQQAAVDQSAFEREVAASRLQVLQAQIEPHFLFNTLANVRRLYDTDRDAGRAMLEHLTRYLAVALPEMRAADATLGRDAELLAAYLEIQQIRMGRRLVFAIDIPAALSGSPVPPMLLLTLAENAVKHGINPSPHGGSIRVSARAQEGRLLLTVADSGVGFRPGSGNGTGLANIRARLAAQFGADAALALQNNELGGVTATIILPRAEVP